MAASIFDGINIHRFEEGYSNIKLLPIEDLFPEDSEQVIVLQAWEHCNLNCRYCYERRKNDEIMDKGFAKRIIEESFKDLSSNNTLVIEIRGGEPFLHFDWIREICDWIWTTYVDYSLYRIRIVSNGTINSRTIKRWLLNNATKLHYVLSIDGSKRTHNYNRSNSFEKIDLDYYLSLWEYLPIYMTVTPQTVKNIYDDLKFLLTKNTLITTNFAFGEAWNEESIEICKTEIKRFIDDIKNFDIKGRINLFGGLALYYKESVAVNKCFQLKCKAANNRKVYTFDRETYPCQFFIPDAYNGYVKKGEDYFELIKTSQINPDRCNNCNMFEQCCTCPAYAFNQTGDLTYREDYICKITEMRVLINAYYWLKRASENELLSSRDCACIKKSMEIYNDYIAKGRL